jgi:hypothetical protein
MVRRMNNVKSALGLKVIVYALTIQAPTDHERIHHRGLCLQSHEVPLQVLRPLLCLVASIPHVEVDLRSSQQDCMKVATFSSLLNARFALPVLRLPLV